MSDETSQAAAPPPSRGQLFGAALILVGAVFAAFWPALSAEFQELWDDNENITQNGYFRGLSGEHITWMFTAFRLGHWQPLSWLSLAVDHAVWGMDPFGYHLTNLVLHAANAVLFFFLVRAVLAAAGSPAARRVAPSLFAALVFAVHPLRVESVVWVTERRDVLSTFFLLATLLAWFRWHAGGGWRWYALALAMYALSLLSKAWGITLPAVLFVLDAYPLRRFDLAALPRLIADKVPFALLAAPAAYLAIVAQSSSGAMHYAEDFTALQKAAQASYGLCFYVLKSLLPTSLSPAYVLDRELDPTQPIFLAAIFVTGLASVAWIALVAKQRLAAITAACLIYAIAVAPVLGLTQSGLQLVADRYSYLSTMPFAILAAAGLARLRVPIAPITVGAAVLMGWLTHSYSAMWRDSGTLWEYATRVDPGSDFAWAMRGTYESKLQGRPNQAIEYYDRALAIDPDEHLAFEGRATARFSIGDIPGALADSQRAIETNERCGIPWMNRATIRSRQGLWRDALLDYEQAVDITPKLAIAWLNLGVARKKNGDLAGARAAFEECRDRASPESPLMAACEKELKALKEQRP